MDGHHRLDPGDPLSAATEIGPAYDINASGQIVGVALISGASHAFFPTPVAPVLLFGAPLILLPMLIAGRAALKAASDS